MLGQTPLKEFKHKFPLDLKAAKLSYPAARWRRTPRFCSVRHCPLSQNSGADR